MEWQSTIARWRKGPLSSRSQSHKVLIGVCLRDATQSLAVDEDALLQRLSKEQGLELIELRHSSEPSRSLRVLVIQPNVSGLAQGALRECVLPLEFARVVILIAFGETSRSRATFPGSIAFESTPPEWLPTTSSKAERWIDSSSSAAFDVWEFGVPNLSGKATVRATMHENNYEVEPFVIKVAPREAGTPAASDMNAEEPS